MEVLCSGYIVNVLVIKLPPGCDTPVVVGIIFKEPWSQAEVAFSGDKAVKPIHGIVEKFQPVIGSPGYVLPVKLGFRRTEHGIWHWAHSTIGRVVDGVDR